MVIRRIDVMSAAKIGGTIGLAIGVIGAILFLLMTSVGGMGAAASEPYSGMGWVGGMGTLAIMVLPIVAAKLVGGIRIETN